MTSQGAPEAGSWELVPEPVFEIEHDGFKGTQQGSYVTREGKRGVVLQQVGTKVVHVYGEKWLKPATSPSPPPGVGEATDAAVFALADVLLGRVNAPEQEIYLAARDGLAAAIAATPPVGVEVVKPELAEQFARQFFDNLRGRALVSDREMLISELAAALSALVPSSLLKEAEEALRPFGDYAKTLDECYPTPHGGELIVAGPITSPYDINKPVTIILDACRKARALVARLGAAP